MPPTDWERVASAFGLPVAIMIAGGLAMWRIANMCGHWIKPHVERVVDSHVRFLDTCDATMQAQSEQLKTLTEHTLDPDGPCQRTVASLSHLSHAVESLGDKCPEVKGHTQRMRNALGE